MKSRLSLADMSLQAKIGLAVTAGLVVGLGLFSWLGLQAVRATTDGILEERLERARIAADLLDENLSHLLQHLRVAAGMVTDINSVVEFEQVSAFVNRNLVDAEMPPLTIMLADGGGRVRQVKHYGPDTAGIDFSRYPEIDRVFKAGSAAVSNAIVDEAGRQVVLAAAPLSTAGDGTTGMIAAAIDIGHSTGPTFNQAMRIGNTGYAEVVDGNGVVLIRTEQASPPRTAERSDHPQHFAQLISEGKAAVRTCHRCHEQSAQTLERRRDLLAFAPLSVATWGVALRQSEEEALAPTRQLERRLLLTGAAVLLGISLLVWAIMQSVVKPVRMLTEATQRVAAGDFKTAAPGGRRDEIGRLNAAFHSMTDELEKSREKLLSRNRELSVLNSIAAAVGQSLDQNLILENALARVLEATGATEGCVLLESPDSGRLAMKARVGCPDLFDCQESVSADAICTCRQVVRSGRTLMANHLAHCPVLKGTERADGLRSFISVPLKSRARTLGVMNVCCPSPERSTESDFKLLESIGQYVGLAIENSTLYEEARHREELRGQLLSRVISAQEEERKRISRELHDEHGQTLTGLIMSLDKMESMISPQQTMLKDKLAKARGLLSRLLDNIRLLTVGLRPSDLDDLGLATAIETHAEERLDAAGISLKFEADLEGGLSPAVETALFRIIQEAINNVIRHAEARNVLIQLSLQRGKVTAVIEDDGQGFDPDVSNRPRGESLGLLGIQERTELLGGTFSVSSGPGRGTRLTIEIPVSASVLAARQDRDARAMEG